MVRPVVGSGLFARLMFHPLVPDLWARGYLVRDFTRGLSDVPALAETGYHYDVHALQPHALPR